MIRGVAAAVAAFVAFAPAGAAVQTFYFSGHDTATGLQVVGSTSYDDATPALESNSFDLEHNANYRAATAFTIQSANWTVSYTGAGSGATVFVTDNHANRNDEFDIGFSAADLTTGLSGYAASNAGLVFATGTQNILSSADLPNASVLPGFDFRTFGVGFASLSGGRGIGFNGTLDYVGDTPQTLAAVPESATWTLMIVGFGLAGAATRKRKVAFA